MRAEAQGGMPSVLQALGSLTDGNRTHERIMLGMMAILFGTGVCFLVMAYFGGPVERAAGLLGGSLFELMIMLPYNKIQSLRKQNIVVGMLAAIIDRFRDKIEVDTLNSVVKDLLNYALQH